MNKPVVVALVIVLALVGGIAAVAFSIWNHYNPAYRGQRVYAWADQAIWDEDPATRQRAADVLTEALRGMQGEPRTQLVMRFCYPRRGGREKTPLPKEVLPVLLEALRAKEIPPGSYPALALSHLEPAEAVPALIGVLENEADPEIRERAIGALRLLGPKARAAVPALRAALDDASQEVRRQAASALEQIDPEAAGKTGRQ